MRAPARLSPLDASFLEVETPTAHMHVGWVAVLRSARGGPAAELRGASRSHRRPPAAGAALQAELRTVPLGLSAPVWVDDLGFDSARHVIQARLATSSARSSTTCMSEPLPRDRPLWQMRLAERTRRRARSASSARPTTAWSTGSPRSSSARCCSTRARRPSAPPPAEWRPAPGPSEPELLLGGIGRPGSLAARARHAAGADRDLSRRGPGARRTRRAGRSAPSPTRSKPAPWIRALNRPISPRRHLAHGRPAARRPARDQGRARREDERRRPRRRGGRPAQLPGRSRRAAGPLKAMVPVSVRRRRCGPARQPDLVHVHRAPVPRARRGPAAARDSRRKRSAQASRRRRRAATMSSGCSAWRRRRSVAPSRGSSRARGRSTSSSRTSPGRASRGVHARLSAPRGLSGRPAGRRPHAVDRIHQRRGRACFGLYADRDALPDADQLAECIDAAIDELARLGRPAAERVPAFG